MSDELDRLRVREGWRARLRLMSTLELRAIRRELILALRGQDDEEPWVTILALVCEELGERASRQIVRGES